MNNFLYEKKNLNKFEIDSKLYLFSCIFTQKQVDFH